MTDHQQKGTTMEATINGRPVAPYVKQEFTPPPPDVLRRRTVYEPLLAHVHLSGQHLGPVVKAILAAADAYGEREEALRLIVARRRYMLDRNTVWQREWQAKASRRPLRNRHHDSWAIRERYVRCDA